VSDPARIIVVTVALGLLWVGLATFIAILAARRLRLAETVLGTARHHAGLLERTPARPLAVDGDGRVSADPQLIKDLGLGGEPLRLDDLSSGDAGLHPDDAAALAVDVQSARESALPFTSKVKAQGSGRVYEVRGQLDPAAERSGAMLLWFYDLSTGEEEKNRLAARVTQAETALASLTQLIEAAPFPMWYRGPDLRLGLVNQAFVQAVEGKSSAEVVERQLELIDASGRVGPVEMARSAQKDGRLVSRMQAAIIGGERSRVTRSTSRTSRTHAPSCRGTSSLSASLPIA
jgi:PAS domain-containing protein